MCCMSVCTQYIFFFFNDTATTEIYTLSLHDALPISGAGNPRTPRPDPPPSGSRTPAVRCRSAGSTGPGRYERRAPPAGRERSEEHTSELQSRQYLVCRLLLEKKKYIRYSTVQCNNTI